jgi:hypothetical protein
MLQGESAQARIQYVDPDGDRPQEVWLVLAGRGEPRRLAADLRGLAKQYRSGVSVTWALGPLPPGRHRAHFEAASIDGRTRYPKEGGLPLVVESLIAKWLLLAVGLTLALAVLPGVVYVGARRAADPAGAARTSLAIGILAAYLWLLWLFVPVYPLPVFLGVGAVGMGLLMWLWLVRR